MARLLTIHPINPQQRLIDQVVQELQKGKLIVYPTDSAYALGCKIGEKEALNRMRRIRDLDDDHNFTIICRDLSEIATYAIIDNTAFRFLKAYTPGPFTFILRATREVPRRILHPKRKTIGLRVPENLIAKQILETLGEPMMTTTLILPNEKIPLADPHEAAEVLRNDVDIVIDGGYCGFETTTVVDLLSEDAVVVRQGKGILE